MLKLRLSLGSVIAKLWVRRYGLKVNCLMTRYPICWVNPNLKDCIQLALLQEHGYQVSATAKKPSLIQAHWIVNQQQFHSALAIADRSQCLQLQPEYRFSFLLAKVIELAEKDLLEI